LKNKISFDSRLLRQFLLNMMRVASLKDEEIAGI